MKTITVGQIVISKAGRDQGSLYLVIDQFEDIAFLANGMSRRLDHLKKKKIKHLQPTNVVMDEIKDKLIKQMKVTNVEIRQAMMDYENTQTKQYEG